MIYHGVIFIYGQELEGLQQNIHKLLTKSQQFVDQHLTIDKHLPSITVIEAESLKIGPGL